MKRLEKNEMIEYLESIGESERMIKYYLECYMIPIDDLLRKNYPYWLYFSEATSSVSSSLKEIEDYIRGIVTPKVKVK